MFLGRILEAACVAAFLFSATFSCADENKQIPRFAWNDKG